MQQMPQERLRVCKPWAAPIISKSNYLSMRTKPKLDDYNHQLGHVLPDMSLAWPGHLQVGPQAPCLRYLSVKRSKQSPSMTLNDCLTAASGAGGQRRCQLPRWLTLKLGTAEVQPSDGFAFERNIEAVCDFGGGLTCYCDPPPCGLKLQLPFR